MMAAERAHISHGSGKVLAVEVGARDPGQGFGRLRRSFRWLNPRRWPLWVTVLLSMVVSITTGYLLERAVVDGLGALQTLPDLLLLLVGVVAALVLVCRWVVDLQSSANAGVFCHAAIENRSDRPLAEDARMRSWVADTWEHARVMPFVSVAPLDRERRGTSDAHDTSHGSGAEAQFEEAHTTTVGAYEESRSRSGEPLTIGSWADVESAAHRLTFQIAHSRVLAPGAKGVTILLHGRPDLMVALGARMQSGVADDGRTFRMLVDDTSDTCQPFLIFDIPTGSAGPESRHLVAAGGPQPMGSGWDALLLIPHPSGTRADDQVAGTGVQPTAFTDADQERHVLFDSPIPEKSSAYAHIAETFSGQLDDLSQVSERRHLFIQGSAPVALVFAAGFIAAARGFTVGSSQWARDRYLPPSWLGSRDSSTQGDPSEHFAVHTLPRWSWDVMVALRAIGLGVFLPLFAASLALVLEWGVARSQGTLNGGDWATLLVFLLASGAVISIGGRFLARRLFDPEVTITTLAPSGQHFAHRTLWIPPEAARDSRSLAVAVTSAFTDALVILPDLTRVEVDLSSSAHGFAAIHDSGFGLRRTLRGNSPVILRWQGSQSCRTGPGSCNCRNVETDP